MVRVLKACTIKASIVPVAWISLISCGGANPFKIVWNLQVYRLKVLWILTIEAFSDDLINYAISFALEWHSLVLLRSQKL